LLALTCLPCRLWTGAGWWLHVDFVVVTILPFRQTSGFSTPGLTACLAFDNSHPTSVYHTRLHQASCAYYCIANCSEKHLLHLLVVPVLSALHRHAPTLPSVHRRFGRKKPHCDPPHSTTTQYKPWAKSSNMTSNLPSSFASAAAGQNANRDARGGRGDGRGAAGGEW
jgi:hypothetical protein